MKTKSIYKTILFRLFSLLFFIFLNLVFFTHSAFAISLDSTFGTNGKVITSFGNEAVTHKIILQTDGKKVVIGEVSNSNNRDWAIARYNSDGSRDTAFGNNGIVLKDFGSIAFGHSDFLHDIIVQSDGKIIVGGSSASSTSMSNWTLARFNPDGSLDTNFGVGGVVITTIRSGSIIEYVNGLILQPDNKIVAVGINHISDTDVALARYNLDGSLDTTFGTGGIVTTPIGGNNDRGIAAALQSNGSIVVLGDFDAGGHDEIFLTRYNSNGSLDTSFGSGGKVITQIGPYDGARGIALQSNGKIVVTGGTNITNPFNAIDTYVARYNSDGSLDSSFGTGGKVVTSFVSGNDISNSLLLQTDGKIILGGSEDTGGANGSDFAVRRFNTNGTLDTTFGANGSFVSPIGSANDEIRSIALQSDGKIVAAGTVSNGSYNDWGIVRYGESALSLILNVPYFSQNEPTPIWGQSEYDHAYSLGATGMSGSMNWWGCAVTSVAMILNYHNIKQFVDGTPINPGSLNEWLKKNGGYDYGFNKKGEWYSSIKWERIGTLTQIISTKSATPKLEWKRIASTKENLNTELSNKRPPVIMVKNSNTKMHFVAAKGFNGDTYLINDPEWDYPDLTNFNKNFHQLDTFKPSQTNLSYLTLVVNPEVEMLVTDPMVRKTGKHTVNGITEIYNEIPDAIYSYEEPISNPGDGEEPKSFGTGVNSFILPTPTNGNYTITLSSKEESFYTINISTTEKDGDYGLNTFQGSVAPNNDDISTVNYSQDDPSKVKKSVSFNSLKSDLQELFNMGFIDNKGILNSLMKKVDSAIKSADKKTSVNILNSFVNELNAQRGKHIKEEAYQVLKFDADYLINNL